MAYDMIMTDTKDTPPMQAPTYKSGAIYDGFMGRWSKLLAREFLECLPLKDGWSFLDVGCGTGSLAKIISESFNFEKIVGIDPSEVLLSHAMGSIPDTKVSFMPGYGESLPTGDNEFDACLALLSLHNVPNPPDAVEEMKRTAKPDALIAACEWNFAEGMEMLNILWDKLVDIEPSLEPLHAKHNKLGKEGELLSLWQKHDLKDIKHHSINIPLRFENFDAYMEPIMIGAATASKIITALSHDQQDQLSAALKLRFFRDGPGGPFTLNARAFAVTGRV